MKKKQKAGKRNAGKNPKQGGRTVARKESAGLSEKDKLLGEGVLVAFLVLLALLPFFQVVEFGFLNLDDPMYVPDQPPVLEGMTSKSLAWAMDATPDNLWHPLTWVSFMVEVEWFGGGSEAPGVHHGGNLFLYAVTLVLFYCFVRRLGMALGWACLTTLLFALHPLHAESVAWVSARKDMLSGVFIFGCLLAYVMSVEKGGRAGMIWRVVSLLSFAAALLSKPSAVVLPALLVLLDWFPLRRGGFEKIDEGPFPWKEILTRQLRSKGVYFALALAAAVVAVSVQGEGTMEYFARKSSLGSRLVDAPGHLAFYFQRLLWPSGLIFEYSHPRGLGAILYPVVGVILALALSWWAWRKRKTFPEVLFGWLWVLGCVAPVLGLFFIGDSYTADRYFYLALAGPVLALVFFLQRDTRWRKGGLAALVVIPMALGFLSFRQVGVWQDDSHLFHHAVSVDPDHHTALGNLGSYYRAQKDEEKALRYYQAALEVKPRDHKVLYNVAQILNNRGDVAGSAAALEASLEGYPNYAQAHHYLGVLLVDPAHAAIYAPEEGLAHLKKACDLSPEEPRYALNYVFNLHRQGRREEAEKATAEALKRLPPEAVEETQRLKKWLQYSGT